MGRTTERNPSWWLQSAPPEPRSPLIGNIDVDVAVVGAGLTGLATALELQHRGLTVAVIEADRVASGSTGFTTAKVTSLHALTYADLVNRHGEDKARQYADANQAAIGCLEALGIECDLQRLPAFTYTTVPERVSEIEAEVEAARSLGLPASLVTDTDLPYDIAAAVRFDDQAQIHPRKLCLGLAAQLTVYEQERVLDLTESDDGVHLETTAHTVRARHAVLATLLPFDDAGGFFAKASPVRSYAMAVRVGDTVPAGMFLSVDSPTRSVRPLRFDDGEVGLVIGGNGHKVGDEPDTEGQYADLERWARATFDVTGVEARWSAQDYLPVDHVPYIGRSPRRDHTYVATGFGKWGMTTALVAASIIADGITGATNPWADVFDATRVDASGSAKDFATANARVARRLIGDKVRNLLAPEVKTLAPGEARVVELDGEKVAAYRDDDGTVHAVSAVCTHIGCDVRWNPAERSWDCPCHGSRFDFVGGVLEGPATQPLESVSVDFHKDR